MTRHLAPMLLLLAAALPVLSQTQGKRVFRCVIDGNVTFQQQACPVEGEPRALQVQAGKTPDAATRPGPAASAPATPAAAPR